jgi:hypothetical protein
MAYQLLFFCRAGEETGHTALERLLDELLVHGPLLGKWLGPYPEAVAVYSLASMSPDGDAVADYLQIEILVGVAAIADQAIWASPNDEHGIWGSDVLVTITLSGDSPDWPLVARIWTTLEDLWAAIPWDEMSGFEISQDAQRMRDLARTPPA